MVAPQPDREPQFRSSSRRIGQFSDSTGNSIEFFHTIIENASELAKLKPANLVDFRDNTRVPPMMQNQSSPDERWLLLASIRGVVVGYSKEFINWKLWGVEPSIQAQLTHRFSLDDPGYLSDYGNLGLQAKAELARLEIPKFEQLYFCLEFISSRVAATATSNMGLFGAWLEGAKIDPQFIKQVARETITT